MAATQVSRPPSSMVGKLPEIQHPLSRLGNPTDMELRGVSRAGDRPLGSGRPLAAENPYPPPRSRLSGRLSSRGSVGRRSMPDATLNIDSIPEGIEVTAGDPNKTRLPIFGKPNFKFISYCYSFLPIKYKQERNVLTT